MLAGHARENAMHAIADTEKLVADGVIDAGAAREIEARARDTMVMLAINTVLCVGIVAATGGLIFWLADALAVALCGALALAVGLMILARDSENFRMFGNAAALIGAGMLIGGAAIELIDKYEDHAHWVLFPLGAAVGIGAAYLWRGALTTRFVTGSILLMGLGAHLTGLALLVMAYEVAGLPVALSYLYATVLIAAAGLFLDVRVITAASIVVFAQALDTGTSYFYGAYVFYSPEPTLSILQMAVLVLPCLWVARHWCERIARHARVLAVLGFIVANLCALVGSLFGDYVGDTIWGPTLLNTRGVDWETYHAAQDTFRETALFISESVYSVFWALLLLATLAYAAFRTNRGMFNTALTFAAIHAYTQLFESFGDEPLAYVIGGLTAIPLAWGMWRLNGWITAKQV
ncbi:MAG: hypothetical protein AAF641_14035 [Pseudomonadota bacterium]